MLPEYQERVAAGDVSAAPFAHEESSYLAKRILAEAGSKHYNTLLDGTGDSSYESLAGKVKQMRATGHQVKAAYVTVDTETALERNRERAKKTGRLPPEAFVRECHAAVSKIVPEAIRQGLFDEVTVYDTNSYGQSIPVVSAKGNQMQVHDNELWTRFLAKAEGR
jgi:predicted ABC-type ATPase